MKTNEKVAVLALLVSLLFLAGCYTQVGRPKVKTEGDISEEYYLEEQYSEEHAGEERPDTVVYHRHDVYIHPPRYYRPLWIDYWWWDAWSWYYDPYWYWERAYVPGYYVGFYFGWGDFWWPYWAYPYSSAEVIFWRPIGYYGGWAYYWSGPGWWVYNVPPPKRRSFGRRNMPILGLRSVAVTPGGQSSVGASLSKRAARRTTTAHESPASVSVAREVSATEREAVSLRRVPATNRDRRTTGVTRSRQRRDEAIRASKSSGRSRSISPAKSSSPDEAIRSRKSSAGTRSKPRVTRRSPPPELKPAPPPKRSSSTRRESRSEYAPRYVPPSQRSWSGSSSGSSGSYNPPSIRRAPAPPPSSHGGSSSGGRPSRRRR